LLPCTARAVCDAPEPRLAAARALRGRSPTSLTTSVGPPRGSDAFWARRFLIARQHPQGGSCGRPSPLSPRRPRLGLGGSPPWGSSLKIASAGASSPAAAPNWYAPTVIVEWGMVRRPREPAGRRGRRALALLRSTGLAVACRRDQPEALMFLSRRGILARSQSGPGRRGPVGLGTRTFSVRALMRGVARRKLEGIARTSSPHPPEPRVP